MNINLKKSLLAAITAISFSQTGLAQEAYSTDSVYQKMIAMKGKYPHGKKWTNRNSYVSKGRGTNSAGGGCVALALILSDAAFGDNQIRQHRNFDEIKVGDMIRLNKNTHTVIIMEIDSTHYTLAEGNFNKSIYWGRKIKKEHLKKAGNYVLTRYPIEDEN